MTKLGTHLDTAPNEIFGMAEMAAVKVWNDDLLGLPKSLFTIVN